MPAKLKRTQDETSPDGIPIERLFPTNPKAVKTLRGHGIVTVEMCSKLTPHGVEVVGGDAQKWVNRAKRFLESTGNSPLWQAVKAMSKQQLQEFNELIDEQRQYGWNAAVDQIAEGLELEIDDRATRANRIRQLKNVKPK
jgi:hypothetical protein